MASAFPPTTSTANLNSKNSRVLLTTATGAVGGLVGALLGEFQYVGNDDGYRYFATDAYFGTGVWFMLAMVGISIALAASEGLLQKNSEKLTAHLPLALAAGLGGGFFAGVIAQYVYADIIGVESQRLARVIGWAIAGALGGLAAGVSFRSKTRVRNGAIGGLGGGAFGGFLFDPIAEAVASESATTARVIALIAIGAAIGLLMGLLDAASTSFEIEVLSREGAARVIPLFDEVSLVGCARNVAVTLTRDPLIREHHLRLTRVPQGLQVEAMPGTGTFTLNGSPTTSAIAASGSIIAIGNTSLRVVGKNSQRGLTAQQASAPHQPVAYQTPPPAASASGWDSRTAGSTPPSAPPTPPAARPTIQMKPKKP